MTRGKQIGFGCLGAFLLVVIGLAGTVFVIATSGARLLEREIEAWKAVGGVIDPLDLQPDPIPDERNAAVIYAEVFQTVSSLLRQYEDWAWMDMPLAAEVTAEFSDAIVRLHVAARMPQCVWPIDYSKGMEMLLPHIGEARVLARILVAEARAASAAGDDQQTAEAVESMLLTADHVGQSPLIVSLLVRIAIENMALDVYEEVFRDTPQPPSDVSRILSGRGGRTLYRDALIGDTSLNLISLDNMFSDRGVSRLVLSRDTAFYLSLMRDLVGQTELPLHEADFHVFYDEFPWWATQTELLIPPLNSVFEAVLNTECRVTMCLAAIDLRAWRDEHGRYPDPAEYQPPIDPAGGRPFEYELDGDGFILRSAATIRDARVEWRWN